MTHVPSVGSRVSVRYRLADSITDVIGQLEATTPQVLVRTKTDQLVRIPATDILAVRELSVVPVRASEIRALEHAAALAWPGTDRSWHDGWLMRAGGGYTSRANSAVPLDISATVAALPALVDWYAARGLPAWLALPDRLVPIRNVGAGVGIKHTRVMVRDAHPEPIDPSVILSGHPDDGWLAGYERQVPAEVLTAVVNGEVVFAQIAGVAVGRGAVTAAPDGTRWLGISAVRAAPEHRRGGNAKTVCAALLSWGADHGATRAYTQVQTENPAGIALHESLGFRLHHHHRYVDAAALIGRTL